MLNIMSKSPLPAQEALYTLADAIAVIGGTTPPPPVPVRRSIADGNARIVELETRLNVKHGLPIFNPKTAARRIEHLEGLLRASGDGSLEDAVRTATALATAKPVGNGALAASPPVILSPASTPPAAARPFESSGDAAIDRAMRANGTHNLRAYKAKVRCDELEADAAKLPAGSLSRKAVESNLSRARAAFNSCQ
jgi:hypothetical protein